MLFSTESGAGQPLILIHGLFGMGDNLAMISRPMSEHFHVYRLDLPNHGRSPRTDDMSFAAMAAEVLAFMDSQQIASAHFVGHSLGGKVAMQLALSHPERVEKLIVADIAPVHYEGHHDQVFAALDAVNLATLKSRRDAEEILLEHIEEEGVRLFILKNLYKNAQGQFDWRLNIEAIKASYSQLRSALDSPTPFTGPTLFIKGELSPYIQEKHRETIERLFPNANLKVIQNASHWLHAEKPVAFNKLVEKFLLD